MQYFYILGLVLRNAEYPLLPTDCELLAFCKIQMENKHVVNKGHLN